MYFSAVTIVAAVLLGAAAPPASALAPATAVRFENYSVEQGLSYDRVRAIAQDGDGYVWIATRDGLNRFDGEHFRVYRHDPADPRSLPDNVVMDLAATPEGVLWIATAGGGLARYDAARDDFVRYEAGDGSGLAGNDVRHVQAGPDGLLWLSVSGVTVQQFDPRSGRARDLPLGRPAALAHVSQVFLRPRGEVIFAGAELLRWDGRSAALESVALALPPDAQPQFDGSIIDRHDTLWLSLQEGDVLRLGLDGSLIARYRKAEALDGRRARVLLETRGGEIWLGLDDGIARFDTGADRFIGNRHDAADPASPAADLHVLFEARDGVIWAGSTLHGVSAHDPRTQAVTVYRHAPADARSLPGSEVQAVLNLPDGDVWLALGGSGLVLFRPGTGVLRHFRHEPADPGSLASDALTALALDREGGLWVGTDGEGLDRLEPGATQFRHYRRESSAPAGLPNNLVNTLFVDADDTLWVGTDGGGLASLCRGCAQFRRYGLGSEDAYDLQGSTVNEVVQAPDRSLWIGLFGGGVLRLDPASGSLRRFPAARDGRGPRSNVVRAMLAGRDGSLWAGSSDGLDRIVRERSGYVLFEPQPPPASELVRGVSCLAEDDTGQIWIGTVNGMLRMDPHSGAAPRRVHLVRGLDQHGYSPRACRSTLGGLLLGSPAGLVMFSPAALPPPPPPGPLLLQDLLLDGQLQRPQPGWRNAPLRQTLAHTPRLALNYQQDVFGFTFAALDFHAGEPVRYRYRLDGLHAGWLPLPAGQHSVLFAGVPPGDYRFRVQALRDRGNPRETSLAVTITPPPWRTTWAYGSYLLLAAGLLLLLLHLRRRLAEARRAANLAQQREQALRQRHHEENPPGERGAPPDLRRAQAAPLIALGELAAAVADQVDAPLQASLTTARSLQQQSSLLAQRLAQRELRPSELAYFQQTAADSSGLVLQSLRSVQRLLGVLQLAATDPRSDPPRRLDVEQCVSDALLLLGPALRATPHQVRVECPCPVVAQASPAALLQIVAGLVRHVLDQAGDTAVQIGIRIEAVDGEARLQIWHDSHGPDPAQHPPVLTGPEVPDEDGDTPSLQTVLALVAEVLGGRIACLRPPGYGFDLRWAGHA